MNHENREIVAALAVKYKGDYSAIVDALERKERLEDEEIDNLLKNVGGRFVTVIDNDYPEFVRRIVCQPPIVLFYQGDISLFTELDRTKVVGVIGSRKTSQYGINQDRKSVV